MRAIEERGGGLDSGITLAEGRNQIVDVGERCEEKQLIGEKEEEREEKGNQ